MEAPPSTLRFLQYFTMILQRIRIIVVDAGFEPGTSAPEVWCATNEPPCIYKVCYRKGFVAYRTRRLTGFVDDGDLANFMGLLLFRVGPPS